MNEMHGCKPLFPVPVSLVVNAEVEQVDILCFFMSFLPVGGLRVIE